MKTADEVLSLFKARLRNHGLVAQQMREIRDTYNGDVVVPLPELERNEKVAVANLTAMGIDQIADRIASTVPNVTFPARRAGFDKWEDAARDKRQAVLGWWDLNQMDLKVYRRARHLVGYGISPVMIRPDWKTNAPRWEIKDPLGTYPAPSADPDDPCVSDCIFAVRQSYAWLNGRYPEQMSVLAKPTEMRPDRLFDVLEYVNDEELVTVVVGQTTDDRQSRMSGGDTMPLTGRPAVVLEQLDNRAGCPLAVVPGRINLDRRRGQFDGMVGMYQAQAKLFALEMIAVEQGIWPNEYLIARPGETPDVVQVANGREGLIGMVRGGDFRQVTTQPGYQTVPTIDRLERGQRLTGGIPADFGGESQNNVRTGRRGENILAATIDYGILQAQRVLQTSMQAENRAAIAVDKAYLNTPKSFYVNWYRAKGQVDYTPSELFDSDQNIVSYAQAGADANGLVIGAGQRVGIGTLSKLGMMELDPLIDDPELEHDRVITEAIEQAVLGGLQQQTAGGQVPVSDAARIMQLVGSDKLSLADAIVKVQREAQERQAAQVPPGAPEAQPGLAQPGMGAEAGSGAPAGPSLQDLSMRLRDLRGGQRLSPAEQAPPAARVG